MSSENDSTSPRKDQPVASLGNENLFRGLQEPPSGKENPQVAGEPDEAPTLTPDPMPPPAAERLPAGCGADYSVLFGMLALEMEFATREQLVAAMHEWMLDKSQTLGAVLVQRQAITERRRTLLEELAAEHVAQHDHDVHKSVVAVSTRDELERTLTGQFVRELYTTLAGPLPAGDRAAAGREPAMAETPRVAGGRFRVLEFLAQGGLGQVLLAEDVELGRTVAVKEIKTVYADDLLCQQRFVLEAEITGGLEHPGIVPVYGRGSYPDGRPFYAMRLICGDTLRAAADAFHRQTAKDPAQPWPIVELQKLLRRFIDVCHAVQYAHSRGVIHRDLKPANVMLGKYGETLVVDWGLAKVVGSVDAVKEFGEHTIRLRSGSGSGATEPGSALGTPAFMSPEQAAGAHDQVGPFSDVYSLGATLYYLLTGQAPFTEKTTAAILEGVKRGKFPRPREVQASVPAALDAICVKAMALSAQDRYPRVAELIEDVERWIADEPVSAYVETRSERLARWMRRHRTGVQAAAAILLSAALIASAAMLVVTRAWRNEKAAREAAVESKAEAVVRFRQAREAVDKWLTGAGHELGYYPDLQKTRSRLLELAAADYEQFVCTHSGDHDLELERGRTYLRLGHLRLSLDDPNGAKEAYQSAQQVFTLAAQRKPDDAASQVELANCGINLGLVACRTLDDAAAEREYAAAIASLDGILRRFADDLRVRASLATALLNRGELQNEVRRYVEAERDLRRAIDVSTQLVAQQPDTTGPLVTAAAAKAMLGRVLTNLGRYTEGLQALNEAAADAGRLVERDPGKPEHLETRAATRVELAMLLGHLGRATEEAAAYRQAVADYEMLAEVLPGVPKFVENRALTQIDIAGLWQRFGQLPLAEQELEGAETALRSLLEKNPDSPFLLEKWAYCREIWGEVLRDRGRGQESKQSLTEALQVYERLATAATEAKDHASLQLRESMAVCRSHLAQTLQSLGELPQAEQEFKASLEILSSIPDPSPLTRDRLAFVHQYFGSLLDGQGKSEDALRQWTAAKQIWAELAAHPGAASEHRYHFAWFLAYGPAVKLRDADKAALLASGLTADTAGNAAYWNCLGAALCRPGQWDKASAALEQAIRLRAQDDGRDWLFLAIVRWHTHDESGARDAFRRGTRWLRETMPGNQEARRLQHEVAALLGEKLESDN